MGCGCPVARGRRGHGVPRAGKSTRDPGVKTTVLGQIGLFVKGDPWGSEAGGIPGGGSGPPADGGGRLARLRLRQVRRQARATLARGRGLTAAVWMGGRAVECTGLENRQRRKSFVGSNPTPSVFFGEKTQRVSVRGGPDRRSEHRLMKRAVISERGPPTLVSSGSRGPPEGRAIRRAPSEIGMGRRRAEWIRISKAGQNEQDHAAAAARSEIGMDARAAARPDSLAIWRLESI